MEPLFTQTITAIIFYAFALIALLSAILVVFSKNPIHCVLALVLTFFASAAIWIMLQADFLGLILVVVYVGAVMTLFLFVVMLLNLNEVVGHKSLVYHWKGVLLLALMLIIIMIAFLGPWYLSANHFSAPSMSSNYSTTKALGQLLYSHYVLPFELAGVLLLLAMVAAIILAGKNQSVRLVQKIPEQIHVNAKKRLRLVKDQGDES